MNTPVIPPADTSTEADAPVGQLILVVDDDAENLQLAEAILSRKGYGVLLARSGFEALALAPVHRIDLVLLDVMMPGLDGFETCRRLRTLPGGEDLPVLFLTALDGIGSYQTAVASGGDDYLQKPFNRTELLLRVRSLIRIRRLNEEIRVSRDRIRAQHEQLLKVQQQKQELIGYIVHDLKSPLTAILGNARFIEGESSEPQLVHTLARRVVDATRSMERMIMDLLDLGRSEEPSGLSPHMSEVDPLELCESLKQLVASRAARRNLTIEVDVSPLATSVWMDGELIRRVLENLADNCLKYSPTGGRLRIEGAPIGPLGGAGYQLRIRDEGLGVPAEFRERIFDRYAQLDRDLNAHGRVGRGLGLAFCRLAIEAHGGRIWVEDSPPRGSCFCVELPGPSSAG